MRLSFVADRLFAGQSHPERQLGLADRYGWFVWLAVVAAFVAVQSTLFMRIHNFVDMRPCIGHSPDPLMNWIPYDPRWYFVTRQLYLAGMLGALALFVWQAVRGATAPLLRWGLALTFMTALRIATLTMIPLCRATITPNGPPPLAAPEVAHLFGWTIPWRSFALNDLVYSGHTAVFILVILAGASWHASLRRALAAFLVLMMYALLATRGHYSIDILLAFPCATFADRLAVRALRFAGRAGARRQAPERWARDKAAA